MRPVLGGSVGTRWFAGDFSLVPGTAEIIYRPLNRWYAVLLARSGVLDAWVDLSGRVN